MKNCWRPPVFGINRSFRKTKTVYRAEYLAYLMLRAADAGTISSKSDLIKQSDEELLETIRTFMAPRYSEGYVKGVHDHDAALILRPLLDLDARLDLLKYSSPSRAIANLFWIALGQTDPLEQKTWQGKLASLGSARKLFGEIADRQKYVDQLAEAIEVLVLSHGVGDRKLKLEAANYLFDQLSTQTEFICSGRAHQLGQAFLKYLEKKKAKADFESSIQDQNLPPIDRYWMARDWVASFNSQPEGHDSEHRELESHARYVDEVASMLADGSFLERKVVRVESVREIVGLLGDHPESKRKPIAWITTIS